MHAVGIIVEYNPFHNGHFYHVQQSKKKTEADCVVAVMSGHFLQRGEPALVSKWTRTRMALAGGADLVIELPFTFAVQQADLFASGAMSILAALNVESFCFGSENGDIEAFLQTESFYRTHEEQVSSHVRQALKDGMSYPKAMALALKTVGESKQLLDLSQPNNILGYAYIKAIIQHHYAIRPYTITRIDSHYHDETLSSSTVTSATSIRKALFSQKANLQMINRYIPESTEKYLQDYALTYGLYHEWEHYFPYLKYTLLSMTPEQLQDIYGIEEGIEHRLLHYIKQSRTFSEFMQLIKNKRYTWTRLQRMCVHILTHTTKAQMEVALKQQTAAYIRLLGMSKNGQAYLKEQKKNLCLPLVSTLSKFQHSQLEQDIKATNVYSFALNEPARSDFLFQEYRTPPIIFDQI
ncbi:MAG TPA: nucleotidyltransferase [Bacillus sp. (in: firmicutes)]|nr:nucleotidyltransferase [Bacillus sp. (in: firmicutes)]